MAKPKIIVSILTEQQTGEDEFGISLLDLLFLEKALTPEFVGGSEPIDNSVRNVDDSLAFWRQNPFMWRRKRTITSRGYVQHTGVYGAGSIIIDATYKESFDWLDLFKKLIAVSRPIYGYLHVVTEYERDNTNLSAQEMQQFSLGAFAKTVTGGFFELGWANFFGNKYRGNVNFPVLKNSVSNLNSNEDGILFSITERLDDIDVNYGEFSERRKIARRAFSSNFFQNPGSR